MERRHKGVVSVIGRMSMSQEMDLIGNLDAIVTMDSATMHIASLLGIPVVSVWGATHPFAGFYGYGQHPDNAVQADLPCRPCSVFGDRPCISGDYRCLSSIRPQEIADRVAKSGRRTEKRQTVTPPTNPTTHSSWPVSCYCSRYDNLFMRRKGGGLFT